MFDILESVSLPLPPGGEFFRKIHSFGDLLSHLVSCEVINDVECNSCQKRYPALKTTTLGRLPKSLCFHIPRTTWSSSGVAMKRDDPVIFQEVLALDDFTYEDIRKRSSEVRDE